MLQDSELPKAGIDAKNPYSTNDGTNTTSTQNKKESADDD